MSAGMSVGIAVGMPVGMADGAALAITAALPRPIVSVVEPQPASQHAAASPAKRRMQGNRRACMAQT